MLMTNQKKSIMKFIKTSYFLVAILILLWNTNAFSQENDTHYITLNVDTATITKQNTDSTCNFGQENDASNEDYTIYVNVGDTIIWEGVSSISENDKVNITAINYRGQPNIFGQNHLNGNGQDPEQVEGTVVTGNAGTEVKYTISFKVLNDGVKRNGTYKIDPKIIIR
jgi:hypothetical protein